MEEKSDLENVQEQLAQPDGNSKTINCDLGVFGDYYVSDFKVLVKAKSLAQKLFKENKKWSGNRVARKVSEALKLRKSNGQVPDNFFLLPTDEEVSKTLLAKEEITVGPTEICYICDKPFFQHETANGYSESVKKICNKKVAVII